MSNAPYKMSVEFQKMEHQPQLMPASYTGRLYPADLIKAIKSLPAGDIVGLRPAADVSALEIFANPQAKALRCPALLDVAGDETTPCVWVYRAALLDNLETLGKALAQVELCADDTPKLDTPIVKVSSTHYAHAEYHPRTDNLYVVPRASVRIVAEGARVRMSGKVAPVQAPVQAASSPTRQRLVWELTVSTVDLYDAQKGVARAIDKKEARPVLRALVLEPREGQLRLLGSNGFRLHLADVPAQAAGDLTQPAGVDGEAWRAFVKGVPRPTKKHKQNPHLAPTVTLRYLTGADGTDGVVLASVGDGQETSLPCIQASRYPQQGVLESYNPSKAPAVVTITDPKPLMEALKRVEIYARDTAYCCRLDILERDNSTGSTAPFALQLAGRSDERGEAVELVELSGVDGLDSLKGVDSVFGEEKLPIFVDVRSLLDAVQWAVETQQTLTLWLKDTYSPLYAVLGDGSAYSLMMPMSR